MIAGLFVAANAWLDVYGIFRCTHGRALKIYQIERTAKYLFARRYIPEGFDGLLIGSSLSSNIPTSRISGWRLYNASLNGGNISEVALGVREALARKKFQVVVVCLHPYLIKNHGRKTSYQDPREYWEALGSPQLLKNYLTWALVSLGQHPDYFDAFGCCRFTLDPLPKSAGELIDARVTELRNGMPPDAEDPIAWQELVDLVREIQANAAHVIAYFPPTPEKILAVTRADVERFQRRTAALFRPQDRVVDFQGPAYRAFREDEANYHDSAHLSERGAERLVEELHRELRAAMPGKLAL